MLQLSNYLVPPSPFIALLPTFLALYLLHVPDIICYMSCFVGALSLPITSSALMSKYLLRIS
ncbi:hypothetical protein OIU84_000643 [Salix udensis]|uniref:Uncharacterized protein n=1 Tax=Salix udensis TaxID=889485 RepID=A0AAD6PMA6_9ROSI|nr:hypothetical protein OIU84_000643 [Salix udensis]